MLTVILMFVAGWVAISFDAYLLDAEYNVGEPASFVSNLTEPWRTIKRAGSLLWNAISE